MWEMLYLGTGIVMCRRITTDRMSDSSGVHGGHGALGAGEQVQVHANVPGGRGNMAPLIPGNPLPQHDASPQDLSGQPPPPPRYMDNFCTLMHGVQSAGSRETRLNMTAEGMESDAHALEHARAVPDPLRDAASDEEGCRHGHFGQALAPEGDFGAPPELHVFVLGN